MGKRGPKGDGLEVRQKGMRIRFQWKGMRVSEPLDREPTPPNVRWARNLAAQIQRKLENGTFVYSDYFPNSPRAEKKDPTSASTVKSVGQKWLRAQGRLSGATLAGYRNALALWYQLIDAYAAKELQVRAPELGATPIGALKTTDLEAIVGSYEWSSAKRCNNALTPLRGLTSVAFRDGATTVDLAVDIKNSELQQPLPDPFTLDEAETILADLAAHYNAQVHNYFDLAFFSGMRPEEEIALIWPDIDWNRGIVRVQRARGFRGVIKPCKGYTARDIELSDRALAAFYRQKAHTFMKAKDGPVFENLNTGKAYHESRPLRESYWDPAIRRTGIRHRGPYHTRHTYATALIMGGCKERWLSKQMGNSPAMIRKHYATWLDRVDNGRQRSLQDTVFGSITPSKEEQHD